MIYYISIYYLGFLITYVYAHYNYKGDVEGLDILAFLTIAGLWFMTMPVKLIAHIYFKYKKPPVTYSDPFEPVRNELIIFKNKPKPKFKYGK